MLPGPRGRMDFRSRGPEIVRWTAPNDRPALENDLQTGIVSGVFCSTGVLLRPTGYLLASIEVRAHRL